MTAAQVIPLVILVVMFIVATKWPLNIGVTGLVASFGVGYFMLGLTDKEILGEVLPASFFFSWAGETAPSISSSSSAYDWSEARHCYSPGVLPPGGFSPLSVAGVLVHDVAQENGCPHLPRRTRRRRVCLNLVLCVLTIMPFAVLRKLRDGDGGQQAEVATAPKGGPTGSRSSRSVRPATNWATRAAKPPRL